MKSDSSKKSGFTIVELILALAIFSFVMVTITIAFGQIMRSYRQSLVSQSTQEAARELVTELLKEAHSTDTLVINDGIGADPIEYLCFGDSIQYEYNPEANTLEKGINEGADCQGHSSTEPVINEEGLQVARFSVDEQSPGGTVAGFNLDLIISTNQPDLLDENGEACNPAVAGAHFCATTRLTTSIGLRTQVD